MGRLLACTASNTSCWEREVEGLQPSSPNGAFRRQGHTGGKDNERRLRLQNNQVEEVEAFLHS